MKVLTPEAEHERQQWESEFGGRGCTCFISPPCNSCTHPGNPANQDEDDTAWVDVFDLDEMCDRARRAVAQAIELAARKGGE